MKLVLALALLGYAPATAQSTAPSYAPTDTVYPYEPSATPTGGFPSATPTGAPTAKPTGAPSAAPTFVPSVSPVPTAVPTVSPGPTATFAPTGDFPTYPDSKFATCPFYRDQGSPANVSWGTAGGGLDPSPGFDYQVAVGQYLLGDECKEYTTDGSACPPDNFCSVSCVCPECVDFKTPPYTRTKQIFSACCDLRPQLVPGALPVPGGSPGASPSPLQCTLSNPFPAVPSRDTQLWGSIDDQGLIYLSDDNCATLTKYEIPGLGHVSLDVVFGLAGAGPVWKTCALDPAADQKNLWTYYGDVLPGIGNTPDGFAHYGIYADPTCSKPRLTTDANCEPNYDPNWDPKCYCAGNLYYALVPPTP